MKTTMGKTLSTAVQLYIDVSGSMNTRVEGWTEKKADLQMRLCVALGNVLERLRIPFQLIAYSESVYLLKNFQNRMSRSPFWEFDMTAGNTKLAHAMEIGFPLLAERRERRKVAIVLTDGDVGMSKVDGGVELAPVLVRKLYPMIETCGFGIALPIPKGAFDYQMDNLGSDLVEKVANQVARVIIKKA